MRPLRPPRGVGPWTGLRAGRNLGRAPEPGARVTLGVAIFVVMIKEAGLAGSLAAFGTGTVTYLGFGGFAVPVSDT